MIVSLKKTFMLVLVALALLAGSFGWTMRMTSPTMHPHHSAGAGSHVIAPVGCPPPPYDCWP